MGWGGGGEKQNPRSSLAFFLPNLGSEAGNLEERGRWKGASGASERAASLLASRSHQEGRERRRKERRGKGGGREGRGGRIEGARKAVCKREKREKTQPPESSEITSRTQAAAERARARARVLSVVWGQTAPRLARSTPQTLSRPLGSGRPLIPLLPLLHLLFQNQNNTREGGKSLPKPADSLKDNKNKIINI